MAVGVGEELGLCLQRTNRFDTSPHERHCCPGPRLRMQGAESSAVPGVLLRGRDRARGGLRGRKPCLRASPRLPPCEHPWYPQCRHQALLVVRLWCQKPRGSARGSELHAAGAGLSLVNPHRCCSVWCQRAAASARPDLLQVRPGTHPGLSMACRTNLFQRCPSA